jgi:hypothetical protein
MDIKVILSLLFSFGILVPLDWPNFVKAQDSPVSHQLIAQKERFCDPVLVCRWVWNGRRWVKYCYWVCPGKN